MSATSDGRRDPDCYSPSGPTLLHVLRRQALVDHVCTHEAAPRSNSNALRFPAASVRPPHCCCALLLMAPGAITRPLPDGHRFQRGRAFADVQRSETRARVRRARRAA